MSRTQRHLIFLKSVELYDFMCLSLINRYLINVCCLLAALASHVQLDLSRRASNNRVRSRGLSYSYCTKRYPILNNIGLSEATAADDQYYSRLDTFEYNN